MSNRLQGRPRLRRPPAATARLTSVRRLAVNGVGLGLWATGAAWLVFHYFLQRHGEFGPEPSPLEPWWLRLHGAFAFATLWTVGLLWGVHVVNGWSFGRRRWSGAVMLGLFALLIVTGWLLYYAGSDRLRAAASLAHWSIGLGLPGLYLIHRLAERARRRKEPS